MSITPKTPLALDAIADRVLAFRPTPTSEAAKKRKRLASKTARAARIPKEKENSDGG